MSSNGGGSLLGAALGLIVLGEGFRMLNRARRGKGLNIRMPRYY